ncbi:polyhydroxyalkanoate synthesis repressor [Azospirillum sp. TSH100]|uniref:polyhydroxyalkanoate synthesis repressor PhaR n=1 Tax=Azospirillum sp. TSH100 TaxID=652764 RepID=UPI000D61C0DA|nr:polyhydroxyalkanoate synthesis repressor PhaR [Azospirillum sp. TSH100]PWC73576.1 polyhydroxyalkanoate synthesis repressor [Azospirillum sp. TSH100]QCG86525.1 polyhydroxyalkanoate synthesis repressor PhaR [Azospirillum sp. TSH100]
MADKEDQKSAPITIKKYANRRLYNTATSSYVTLDHLCQMVKDGLDFVVYDAKTGEDITRSVLTQIIVEEESKGQNLLPISFLRQLIGFYGDNMQSVVPRYLEYSMQAFSRNQEQMRDYFQNTLGGMFPFGRLDEVSKQNMAMFERAMRMFTPFGAPGATDEAPGAQRPAGQSAQAPAAHPVGATFDELQKQIDELQKQIASIASPSGKSDTK